MEYNKTKRGLEKASGIVGVVISSIVTVLWLYEVIVCISLFVTWGMYSSLLMTYLIMYFIELAFSVVTLITYASVIKSPVQEDGTIKPTKGRRICVVVFSALTAQWVTMGLMIAVLCMKDFKDGQPSYTTNVGYQGQRPVQAAPSSIDGKIAELKHLKELGVIDEEGYKKAVERLLKQII